MLNTAEQLTPLSIILRDRTQPNLGELTEISWYPYAHWDIYIGKAYVVHMTPPSEVAGSGVNSFTVLGDTAIVTKELLSVVAGGDAYRVNKKNDEEYDPLPPPNIVQQAEQMVGKVVSYSVTSNNCGHFVNALRYRVSRSDQVCPQPVSPSHS
uniref:LOW QUALITY PROTEIN: phospholipase A and acyltransferase 2-like n=1 Tax=Ictidomys tridecemlineatus TaxID=43179 RepID=UPI001A9CDD1F|nr:LOW QUALITY PROTEIN: phospholipase A and acyltransferase 2-like [Ictidomys tridecemlineatus]